MLLHFCSLTDLAIKEFRGLLHIDCCSKVARIMFVLPSHLVELDSSDNLDGLVSDAKLVRNMKSRSWSLLA